jgi:hypothetical protein
MIGFQGFKDSKDSVFLVLDNEGIDELIDYLNFIKNIDSSMHLNIGNELVSNDDIDDDMYYIPHVKLINSDKL